MVYNSTTVPTIPPTVPPTDPPTDPTDPEVPTVPTEPTRPAEPNPPIDITEPNIAVPKTGDASDMLPWIILMVASGGVISALGIKKKNRKAE